MGVCNQRHQKFEEPWSIVGNRAALRQLSHLHHVRRQQIDASSCRVREVDGTPRLEWIKPATETSNIRGNKAVESTIGRVVSTQAALGGFNKVHQKRSEFGIWRDGIDELRRQ